MYERFSGRLLTTFKLANSLASERCSEYISPEHLLLGLLEEAHNSSGGEAAQSMKARGISVIKVKERLEEFLPHHRDRPTPGKLPQTPRSKRVCENMCEEALNSQDSAVKTWHLLLAISKEEEGDAARVLAEFRMSYDELVKWCETGLELSNLGHNLLVYNILDCKLKEEVGAEQDFLNEQAAKGWELVSVVRLPQLVMRYYFKRKQ
jgi:ATP-dependent Clp protease ATP-binding subunit ClpA